MKVTLERISQFFGQRRPVPENKKSFLGYQRVSDTMEYAIYQRPVLGKQIIAAYENTIVKQVNSRVIELYPDFRSPLHYRFSLNSDTFPGLFKNSIIHSCALFPYMRIVKQDTYVQSLRLCVITNQGQIYHNYPARCPDYDGFPTLGDIKCFEESVVWDLPDHCYPSNCKDCRDLERYFPNLPETCYQYHPICNDSEYFEDPYGNGGFPRVKTIHTNNEKKQFVTRFYQYSRQDQANSFHFIGGAVPNYKMNIIATYRGNVEAGVRTCIFATDDGGRQWYCKYEFSDIGEYEFQQGHSGMWGHNWGNPIILDCPQINMDTAEVEVFRREIILPQENDKNTRVKFHWKPCGCISKISQDNTTVLHFRSPHGLSTGNIVAIAGSDDKNVDSAIMWMLNTGFTEDFSGGLQFKVEVIDSSTVKLYELVSSSEPTLPCRHVHHINRVKDGWLIGTGEVYPNSWVLYMQMLEADTYAPVYAANSFPLIRLNTSSNSLQRTMGVLISDSECPCILYASDHDTSARTVIPELSLPRNSTGVFLGKLSDLDDRNQMHCIFEAEEPAFYFQRLENMMLFCGQRGEIGICKDPEYSIWYREHIKGPIVYYYGSCHNYFVFNDVILLKK